MEIAGGLFGLVAIAVITPARMQFLLALHLLLLVVLVLVLFDVRRREAWLLAALPAPYLVLWAAIDRPTLAFYYAKAHGLRDTEVIASEFSPYQRVDLIGATTRSRPVIYLYLNGNLLYGSRSLHQHNLLGSIAPNLMIGPDSRAAAVQAQIDAFVGGLPEGEAQFGVPRITAVADGIVRESARGFAPIGEADMQIALRMSWRKLTGRFYDSSP